MPEQTSHPVSAAPARFATPLRPEGPATGLSLRANGLPSPTASGPGGFGAVLAQLLSRGASPATDARPDTMPGAAIGPADRSGEPPGEQPALWSRDGSNLPPTGRKLPLARTVEQLLNPDAAGQRGLSPDAPGGQRMPLAGAGRELLSSGESGPDKRPISNELARIDAGPAENESEAQPGAAQPGITVVGPDEALSGRPVGSGDPGAALTGQTRDNALNAQGGDRTLNADLATGRHGVAARADATGAGRDGLTVRADGFGERPVDAAPGGATLKGERVNGGGQGLPTAEPSVTASVAATGTGQDTAMRALNGPETRPAGYRDGPFGRQEGPASRLENNLSATGPATGTTAATTSTDTHPSAGWQDSRPLPGASLDNSFQQSRQPLELAVRESAQRLQRFAEQWSVRQEGSLNGGPPQGASPQAASPGSTAGGPTHSLSAFATLIGTAQGATADNATGAQSAATATSSSNGAATASTPTATANGTAMPGSPITAAPDPAVRSATGMVNTGAATTRSGAAGNAGEGSAAAREQWGEALSRRISLMTARNQNEARVQLDPPELGRLMIQLQIQNEQAAVQFTSPHALVRDALEGSMPKLQDLLAEEGLDLVDVDISDEGNEQAPDGQGSESGGGSPRSSPVEGADDETVAPRLQRAALSLVDDYA